MWLELKKPWAGETRNVKETLLDANERIIETDLISFEKTRGIPRSSQKLAKHLVAMPFSDSGYR